MQKNRVGGKRFVRGIRQGVALFLAVVGLWMLWLTGDPGEVWRELAAGVRPEEDDGGLSLADRLVLGQSVLLRGEVIIPDEKEPERGELLPTLSPATPAPEQSAPPSTAAPEDIIEKTMVAGTSGKYITAGRVSIYNHTNYAPDIEEMLREAPKLVPAEEGPTVLIFHSHATEAYTMDGTDLYEESDSYRTLNTRQNMVRIGEEMKAILEAAGIGVIHDTTLYDYPKYNEAYNRSAAGVARWLEEYPSIRLVLDVHRDALAAADGTIYKTAVGTLEDCAQVMLVMGSDAMGQEHPNWRTNLALALSIQEALTAKWSTLARPLVLRTSRFNQQLSPGMLLVEVGTHGNTLQEAIRAARIFARTVTEMMLRE